MNFSSLRTQLKFVATMLILTFLAANTTTTAQVLTIGDGEIYQMKSGTHTYERIEMGRKSFDEDKQPLPQDNCEQIVFIPEKTLEKFVPPHAGGGCDGDFYGPVVINSSVALRISSDKTKIFADVYMKAQEPKSCHSKAEGRTQRLIYTSPSGYKIKDIRDFSYLVSIANYIDHVPHNKVTSSGDFDYYRGESDTPVKDWTFIGDTKGIDVGKTMVQPKLNSFNVLLVREGPPCNG